MAEIKSILTSVKATLGLAEDYPVYDQDVIMHINSTLGTLSQLGLGPPLGFVIEDDAAEWDDFLGGDPLYSSAKSYVYICVRLLFDSSSMTGPVLQVFQDQKKELEWRLMVAADPYDETIIPDDDDLVVIDGGGP